MSQKIAVMVASPCVGHLSPLGDVPNHYRYTLFEKIVRQKSESEDSTSVERFSNLLLRYENMRIEQLLEHVKVTFGVHRRSVAAQKSPAKLLEDGRICFDASAVVSGDDRVIAHSLGEHMGYKLYVIYKQSCVEGRNALGYFSLSNMPNYGRSSVVYDPQVARQSFEGIRITQTRHESSSDSDENLVELFDHMNALIAPIMAPMVALLPPPQ